MKRLLALLLLATPLHAASKPGPELIVRPRLAVMTPHGVNIVVTVKILHPTEELYCPEVEFVWEEGQTSKIEADCDPPKPGEFLPAFYLTRAYVYGGGTHEIVVNLRQGKTRVRLEGRAEVMGE